MKIKGNSSIAGQVLEKNSSGAISFKSEPNKSSSIPKLNANYIIINRLGKIIEVSSHVLFGINKQAILNKNFSSFISGFKG